MQVGDKVMVRDTFITQDYQVPPAEIVEVKNCDVLLRKSYLLRFDNGKHEWFTSWMLKTQ